MQLAHLLGVFEILLGMFASIIMQFAIEFVLPFQTKISVDGTGINHFKTTTFLVFVKYKVFLLLWWQ